MKQRITQKQIEMAKSISIMDYLQTNEPQEIKQVGRYYTLRTHDSMRIDSVTGKWFWNSQNIRGSNAIDYLMSVYRMTFIKAVKRLANEDTIVIHSSFLKPIKQKQFQLPERNKDNNVVISYLMSRCIDKEIIETCIKNGKIYESASYHACVFVGYDENKVARFASVRATKGSYKSDVAGSQKAHGFALEAHEKSDTLYVFESPIDLLSHATLQKKYNNNWRNAHRLALGGVSTAALECYLQRNMGINELVLCLDSDKARQEAMKRICVEYQSNGYLIRILLPENGKDYNESLLLMR